MGEAMTTRERILLIHLPRAGRVIVAGSVAALVPLVVWWLAAVCPAPPAWVVVGMIVASAVGGAIGGAS